ncbi:MAG: hypothetical protein Q4C35_12690, partial [Eubacteriales bacterium]|nr:hypothetical protein [Eubacteriales bacterium]
QNAADVDADMRQPFSTPSSFSVQQPFPAQPEPLDLPAWLDAPQDAASVGTFVPPTWAQAPVAAQAATATDSLPSYLKRRLPAARPLRAEDLAGTQEEQAVPPAVSGEDGPRPRRRRADRNRALVDEPTAQQDASAECGAAGAVETDARPEAGLEPGPSSQSTAISGDASFSAGVPGAEQPSEASGDSGAAGSPIAEAPPEAPAPDEQSEPFDPYDHDDEPAPELPPLPDRPDAAELFFPAAGEPGAPYAPIVSGEAACGPFAPFSDGMPEPFMDGVPTSDTPFFSPEEDSSSFAAAETRAASQPEAASYTDASSQAPYAGPAPQPFQPSFRPDAASWHDHQPAPPQSSQQPKQPPQAADRLEARFHAQAGPKAAPKSQARAAARQAQAHSQPQRPPVRVARVLALIAAALMLLFCGVVGSRIISDLAQNERQMKAVRDDYRERNGAELESGAARVELLPAGQTFAPTATPTPTRPVQTPTPTPVIPIREAAVQSLNKRDSANVQETPEPSATPNPRTRLEAYPNNPLRNVMDSLLPLCAENADVIGRLTIPGVLDEVVVKRNNTYYLTRNYRGASSDAGAVFADESCSLRIPPENLLLRGQSAVEGKTFAPLWQYATAGRDFVASAASATLTTLYEQAQYTLFAVIVADSDPASGSYFNYGSHPTFATDEAMLTYVESARTHSLYQFNVDVQASDRLLTLATIGGDSCLVLLWRLDR